MTNKEKLKNFKTKFQTFKEQKKKILEKNELLLTKTEEKKATIEKELKALNEQYISLVVNDNDSSKKDNDTLLKNITSKQNESELINISINRIKNLDIYKDKNLISLASSINSLYGETIQSINFELSDLKKQISKSSNELLKFVEYYRELKKEYNVVVSEMMELSKYLSDTDEKILLFDADTSISGNISASDFIRHVSCSGTFDNFYCLNNNAKEIDLLLRKLDTIKRIHCYDFNRNLNI